MLKDSTHKCYFSEKLSIYPISRSLQLKYSSLPIEPARHYDNLISFCKGEKEYYYHFNKEGIKTFFNLINTSKIIKKMNNIVEFDKKINEVESLNTWFKLFHILILKLLWGEINKEDFEDFRIDDNYFLRRNTELFINLIEFKITGILNPIILEDTNPSINIYTNIKKNIYDIIIKFTIENSNGEDEENIDKKIKSNLAKFSNNKISISEISKDDFSHKNILDKLILKYDSINKDSLFIETEPKGIFRLSIDEYIKIIFMQGKLYFNDSKSPKSNPIINYINIENEEFYLPYIFKQHEIEKIFNDLIDIDHESTRKNGKLTIIDDRTEYRLVDNQFINYVRTQCFPGLKYANFSLHIFENNINDKIIIFIQSKHSFRNYIILKTTLDNLEKTTEFYLNNKELKNWANFKGEVEIYKKSWVKLEYLII